MNFLLARFGRYGGELAETGFDVRSRRRNRPPAGPATNKLAFPLKEFFELVQLRGADDGFHDSESDS